MINFETTYDMADRKIFNAHLYFEAMNNFHWQLGDRLLDEFNVITELSLGHLDNQIMEDLKWSK